jgi:hypothetical protein
MLTTLPGPDAFRERRRLPGCGFRLLGAFVDDCSRLCIFSSRCTSCGRLYLPQKDTQIDEAAEQFGLSAGVVAKIGWDSHRLPDPAARGKGGSPRRSTAGPPVGISNTLCAVGLLLRSMRAVAFRAPTPTIASSGNAEYLRHPADAAGCCFRS